MALEDVLIGLQVVEHGGECGMQFGRNDLSIFHVTDSHVVLLCLDIQQVVDRQLQVITSYIGIVDGHGDVYLLVGGLVEQCLQLVAQVTVVAQADGADRYEHADDQRPVEKCQEGNELDRKVEHPRANEEVTDADKQDHR